MKDVVDRMIQVKRNQQRNEQVKESIEVIAIFQFIISAAI